jgi:putative oxidoreductase
MESGESLGKLVLRLTVGGLLLLHGVHKLLDGIEPIQTMLGAHGLPDWLAYGVYLGEVVAPILVILGLFARIGGFLIVADMIVAVLLAKTGQILMLDPNSGGYALELEAFYLFGGLSIALIGAGGFSIGGQNNWN